LRLFTEFFDAVPWFLPGVVLWGVASAALAPTVGRALQTRNVVAFALSLSFGVVLLATLSPTAIAISDPEPSFEWCDLDRLTFPPLSDLLSINDAIRNVLLFIPLGFTLGLLPWTRQTLALVVLAYLLPFAIEALQLAVPILGRGCQSADIIDNATGLTVGLLAAAGLRQVARWRSARGAV
jgi:hypothetical protein